MKSLLLGATVVLILAIFVLSVNRIGPHRPPPIILDAVHDPRECGYVNSVRVSARNTSNFWVHTVYWSLHTSGEDRFGVKTQDRFDSVPPLDSRVKCVRPPAGFSIAQPNDLSVELGYVEGF